MILDSFNKTTTELSPNVCNHLLNKKSPATSEATRKEKLSLKQQQQPHQNHQQQVYHRRPSSSSATAALLFSPPSSKSLSSSKFSSPLVLNNNNSSGSLEESEGTEEEETEEERPNFETDVMDKSSPSRSPSSASSDVEDGAETLSTDRATPTNSKNDHKPTKEKSQSEQQSDQTPKTGQSSPRKTTNTSCDPISESNLADNIKSLESIIQSLKDSTTAQISQLRDLVTQKDKIIFDLTEKLELQRDYDEIKRELSMLRNELSHFGPTLVPTLADVSGVGAGAGGVNNSHVSQNNNSSSAATQSLVQRNTALFPFPFPQLQSLGNVESFGTLLGEEIASSYAKAMAAAAGVSSNNSSNNIKSNANSNQNNNGNNRTDSLSPSQLSNGDEVLEEKSTESASTTPTSAMICPDGAEPLTHSPLGATTVSDLGLNLNNAYSPTSHNLFYDKLQHQLRCNVEKYMNETLNTLQISRFVRELLSVHNIGQRLFAKYVLGLSQGTVSELLSKPKPWDKLTEKGRDSYRKMHAWSTDERCINLLKMMVPRKEYGSYLGKDTTSQYQSKQDDAVAEERIAQILNEAQRSMAKGITRTDFSLTHQFLNGSDNIQAAAMKVTDLKNINPHSNNNDAVSDNGSDRDENKSEASIGGESRKSPSLNATAMATISNFYRNINDDSRNNSRSASRTKFPENDEANQASELMRLYQDHLTKMIGQQIEEGIRNSQNYDDIRNVLALQQDLSRINPFMLQTNPELFARLLSSGLLNGAQYLNGLPLGLDAAAAAAAGLPANQLDQLRKNSQIDSSQQPQPLRDQGRDSTSGLNEPRIKIDNLLSQIKTEQSASPSQNGSSMGPASNNISGSGGVFNNGENSDDMAASPLQRMQSITNSLLSQSTIPTLPSQPPRPAKAVLPPITQQQFDQYNNLNTEEIVKRVKEQLSQYSISQRLFGESVLGLSQGSVSDLLARPKPWHMLTQKGREPFIRMKMFLEDDNAIHKLVASQYKIAPEKLMRTGNFVSGAAGLPPGIASAMNAAAAAANLPPTAAQLHPVSGSPSPLSLNSLNPSTNTNSKSGPGTGAVTSVNIKPNPADLSNLSKYEQSMSPSSVDNSARSNTSSPDLSSANVPPSAPSPLSMRSRLTSAYANMSNNPLRATISSQPTMVNAFNQPSVYELAALTSDLDTQIITTRIKETLMAHNIGQKIFGEVVLGLSQGSVSELLSKPKPWHMLSIKGREPFIRMQLWLNDANNIDKLQTLKNERREANKRRRTHLDEGLSSFKPFDNQLFNLSNTFNSLNPLGKPMATPPGTFPFSALNQQQAPVVKKARILFTEEQKEALRIAFAMDPYPSSATAEFLAKELNLSIRTITNWFHNHRMRLKQINSSVSNTNAEDSSGSNPASGTSSYNLGRDSVLFDQGKFRQLLTQRLADLKLRSSNLTNSANNNASNDANNSNQFNNSFSQNSPPHQLLHHHHRMKYSPSPSLFQSQSIYSNNTNSCSSPGSSSSFHEEEDMGTLDLSMTSHNNQPPFRHHHHHHSPDKLDSTGRSSMHDDSDDGCRTGEDDDVEDESAANTADTNERIPGDQLQSKRPTTPNRNNMAKQTVRGSSRRKPQNVMSSSSRRKAAQPQQWVAPPPPPPMPQSSVSIDPSSLVALNYGSVDDDDDYIDDEFDDDDEESEESRRRTENEINGLYQQLANKDKDDEDEGLDQSTKDNVDDFDEDQEQEVDDVDGRNLNGSTLTPPSFKKLKTSAAAKMSGIKDTNDANANSTVTSMMQECVQ